MLCLNRCAGVVDCVFTTVPRGFRRSNDGRAGFLRVKLLGWGLLVGGAGGFPLSQVVAALVLLPHAVDQEEDEEDGEQEADHATCDDG